MGRHQLVGGAKPASAHATANGSGGGSAFSSRRLALYVPLFCHATSGRSQSAGYDAGEVAALMMRPSEMGGSCATLYARPQREGSGARARM